MHAAEEGQENIYQKLKLFGEIMEHVRDSYVEEPDDAELIEAAINGLLSSLDPHSSYLNAEDYRNIREETRGLFGGLGIEVTMETGLVKIIAPIDDTPAARAGLQAGDFIVKIDETPILGMSLSEAVEKMRGEVGTDINLTIERAALDNPFEVKLTRALIKVRAVRHRLEKDVGYIRITRFNDNTHDNLESSIRKLKEEAKTDLIGYIVDLRNNPGGLLDQAVAVSDSFLDQGEIVSTRGRQANDVTRFNAREGDLAEGKPIIVLINGGSASASEIVAGALQDQKRAVLLGTKSFGKGSVQTIVSLGVGASRGALRLTTQRYYTPSGRSIQAKGIIPDLEVEQAKIENIGAPQRLSESQLPRHLTSEGQQEETIEQESEPADETIEDYQLSYALDLLRSLHVVGQNLVKQ